MNQFSLDKLRKTMTEMNEEKDADQVYLLIRITAYIVKIATTLENHDAYKKFTMDIGKRVKAPTIWDWASGLLPFLNKISATMSSLNPDLVKLYTDIQKDFQKCQSAIAKYTVGTQIFEQTISMAPTATSDVRDLVESLIQQLDKHAYLKIDFINICLRYAHDLDSSIETKKPTKRPSLQPLTHGNDIVDLSMGEIMSLAEDCDMTVPANRSRIANLICILYKHDVDDEKARQNVHKLFIEKGVLSEDEFNIFWLYNVRFQASGLLVDGSDPYTQAASLYPHLKLLLTRGKPPLPFHFIDPDDRDFSNTLSKALYTWAHAQTDWNSVIIDVGNLTVNEGRRRLISSFVTICTLACSMHTATAKDKKLFDATKQWLKAIDRLACASEEVLRPCDFEVIRFLFSEERFEKNATLHFVNKLGCYVEFHRSARRSSEVIVLMQELQGWILSFDKKYPFSRPSVFLYGFRKWMVGKGWMSSTIEKRRSARLCGRKRLLSIAHGTNGNA